ncbi:MAG TPA: hypothetical protein VGP07_10635 [Polyangia bacterium]|jgi:hypothetical protein
MTTPSLNLDRDPRALDARTPLLLLPVNLETRFTDLPDGRAELWLRVYPDQLAIDAHEPELTAQEVTDGRAYWDALWRAGNPPTSLEAVKAPWRGLAARHEPPRAAWIARSMTPDNVAARPAAATPDGADPVPAPVYPVPAARDSSWEKPALAALLPDAWKVALVSGGVTSRFVGGPIRPGLAVGLTPGAGAFPAGSPVDAGMTWLVDFDEAVKAGMALKIPLEARQRAAGFEQIFVYGTRTTGRNADGGDNGQLAGAAAALGALLDGHHYSDGFALIPQGAPTNNTTDADAGYARKDPDFEQSFAIEIDRQVPLTADPTADGNVFANLLGLDPALLAHVGYADGVNARSGADMLTALWPATLGYFLKQMMAEVFPAAEIESARQYVLANALPRGPVPAFRVGRTPYGVLPVTSLRHYPAATGAPSTVGTIEPALVDFIKRLWPTWLASADAAPHMQRSGDPDKELLGLLGMDASSMTFRGREILGDDFLWNYLSLARVDPGIGDAWWTQHLARGRQLLDAFGFTSWDPRLIHTGMAGVSAPVPFPTVQAGPLSESEGLKADADLGGGAHGNYIVWLRRASIDELQAESYPGPKPTALLYKILRQALLLDYADLAATQEVAAGRLQLSQFREAELVSVPVTPSPVGTPPPPPAVSAWELLARPSTVNAQLTWAEFLVSYDPPAESPFARLTALRASLERLAVLPTAELDRLLTETLDACSHRLDVWAGAVANALLRRARAAQVTGVHLGAFGWVEDVRPATRRAAIAGAELARVRAVDQLRAARMGNATTAVAVPLEPRVDNGGFIHAPSFAQATTAAVLRNGFLVHEGTPDQGQLALDLSSARVRKALDLLDGVRQGEGLGALLGFLFEAGLHDGALDTFAQPFRDRFPLVANKLTPSSAPSEAVAASNVVDGVALRAAFAANAFPAGRSWGADLPAPGAAQTAVLALLAELDDAADALGDLSIAEAVFQIVRGNFGRAGGLMDAVSRGERPPDPDVIDTPRGGLDLTQRVALLFAGAPSRAPAWSAIAPGPRGTAEPALDAWLSQKLPDPALVTCDVAYQDGAGAHAVAVRLVDLAIGPLDCLALADAAEVPQQSELEARILFAAPLPPGSAGVSIDYRPAAPPPGAIAFPDFFFLAKSLRALVGGARPLGPQDLTVPEKNAAALGGAVDEVDLRGRATVAVGKLQTDVNALQTASAGLPGAPDPARAALMAASRYGVAGAIPITRSGPGAALAAQVTSVLATLQARLTKATELVIATATADDLTGLFSTLFGGLVVLPRLNPPEVATLQAAFAQSPALRATDAGAPARWLQQSTYVRPGVSRLEAALSLAQLLGPPGARGAAAELVLGQLPLVPGDRWLALSIDPAHPPDKGRVAFACITAGDPITATSYAGLMVDEWPERIPSTTAQSAVAFHYEEPSARAPQALLLAVCPDARPAWDDTLIEDTLQETLELAKLRTVDLDSVQQVGQILPALYFALNLRGASISTNLTVAKEVVLAAPRLS